MNEMEQMDFCMTLCIDDEICLSLFLKLQLQVGFAQKWQLSPTDKTAGQKEH